MDIHTLAIVLLTGHLAAIFFMALVMIRQSYIMRKLHPQPSLVGIRVLLLALSITVTIGNLISVGVDALTIFDLVERSTSTINPIGLVYSGANMSVALISALIIWLLYRMAKKTLVLVDYDKEVALKLKKDK